jgi:hypothetical protein
MVPVRRQRLVPRVFPIVEDLVNNFWYQLRARLVRAGVGGSDLGLADGNAGVLQEDLLEHEQARDAVPEGREKRDAPQEHREPSWARWSFRCRRWNEGAEAMMLDASP